MSSSWVIFQHQTQNWYYLFQNLLAAEISWDLKNSPHTEHSANTESNTTQTHIRHCPETVYYKNKIINAFDQFTKNYVIYVIPIKWS